METIEQLNDELVEFFNRFSSWEASVIQPGPLTLAETHAIEVLGHHDRMNMKSLAQKLGVTTGTTTVTVDRLERRGLARRTPAEKDRRSYIIELTPEGDDAFLAHHRHHLQLAKEIASVLSDEEIGHLIAILEKINGII